MEKENRRMRAKGFQLEGWCKTVMFECPVCFRVDFRESEREFFDPHFLGCIDCSGVHCNEPKPKEDK